MNDLPRQKLREIIATYGRSLCEDPQRCEGLLRDFCGEYKPEIFALISALKERVAAELLASSEGVPGEVLVARLTKRLHDNLALSEEAARWAVESWAVALGKISLAKSRTENTEPGKQSGGTSVWDAHTDPFAQPLTGVPEEQLRQAIRTALADKQITEWEKSELQDLRRRLNIPSELASRIFAEVKAEMNLDVPPPLPPKSKKRWLVGVVGTALLLTAAVVFWMQQQERHILPGVATDEEKGQEYVQQMVTYAMVEGGLNNEADIAAAKGRIEALNLRGRLSHGERKKARALNDRGLAYIQGWQFAEAVQAFQAAYQADPADLEIINNLGHAYMQNGNTDSAQHFLLLALVLSPSRSAAWGDLGQLHAREGNVRAALACFANAYRFSRKPDSTREYLRRLVINGNDGEKIAAEKALQLTLIQTDGQSRN